MLRLLIVAAYIIACNSLSFTKAKVGSRIINGKHADKGQFPFAVSLQQYYPEVRSHVCTLSLITEQTCLGAAHCLFESEDTPVYLEDFCGIVNSLYQNERIYCHEFDRIVYHQDYEPDLLDNDIALFDFKYPIYDAKTVTLADLNTEIAGKTVIALGWGYTVLGGYLPRRLRYDYLRVANKSLCEAYFDELTSRQVCLFQKNAGTCRGDSGGPIMLADTDVQIAVVSFGVSECDMEPSVNTDVRYYVDWIRENTAGKLKFSK